MTPNTVACPHCGQRNRVPAGGRGKPRCAKCRQWLPWIVSAGDRDFAEVVEGASVPALVDFWATWCGPCRAEIPDLIKLQARYPDHLQIIGVSADEGPVQVVEDFATAYGINYPIVMSTPELNRAFPGVMALPTSFIIDPEGRVVQTHIGLINPGVLEQETRFLAALDLDITVDIVDENQHGLLVNAAQATEIPGLDLTTLTPEQRTTALQRLNQEGCTCGCKLTLAQCRINDSSCGFSLPLAEQVVAEIVGDPA